MNQVGIALLAALFSVPVFAAETSTTQEEPHALIHGFESGGYGAPEIKYSEMASQGALFAGGRGGWVINHQFVLGGAAYGLVSSYAIPSIPGDRLSFGYGGLLLEYIIESNSLIHAQISALLGGGALGVRGFGATDAIIVAEPQANLIVNLTHDVRAGMGVGYRVVRGAETANLSNTDLSGLSYEFMIQFGTF